MKRIDIVLLASLALCAVMAWVCSGCATGANNKTPFVAPIALNLWKSSSTTLILMESASNTVSNGLGQTIEGGGSASIPASVLPLK